MTDQITEAQATQDIAPRFSLQELEQQVIAAALSDTDVLEFVSARFIKRFVPHRGRRGEPEIQVGEETRKLGSLLNAAKAYFNVTRGLMTRDALAAILANNEPDLEKHQEYLALYDVLTHPPYSDYTPENRRWFLHQYDVEWQIERTGDILATAAEAMRQGHNAHGKVLRGSEAAWQVIFEQRIEFDNAVAGTNLSEAEITSTTHEAWQDYQEAKESDLIGVPLALPEVNDRLYGLRPGDLFLVAGFAGEGKSFMMTNDGHTGWINGKNIVIATGEMGIKKYRSRLIALHSNLPQFPRPLETTKIDRGLLDDEEIEILQAVLQDMKNEHGRYGKLFVFPFPFRATPSLIYNKVAQYDQVVPIDMMCLDYLGLMTSERARVSRREELDDLIREVKALALDFGDGRGLAVEAGFQVNRASYERARQDGYYTLACFAESSEAEKSADAAMWLLNLPQNPDEVKMGFIKNRDNELGEPWFVHRLLRSAKLQSMRSQRTQASAGPQTTQQLGANLLDL